MLTLLMITGIVDPSLRFFRLSRRTTISGHLYAHVCMLFEAQLKRNQGGDAPRSSLPLSEPPFHFPLLPRTRITRWYGKGPLKSERQRIPPFQASPFFQLQHFLKMARAKQLVQHCIQGKLLLPLAAGLRSEFRLKMTARAWFAH